MAYKIDDGKGSTSKPKVFDKRIREFAASLSLMNYVSAGKSRSFTLRNNTSGKGSMTIIALANGDPNNLVVIDSIIVQITSSGYTLPNETINIGMRLPQDIQTLTTQLHPIVDNQSNIILPMIFDYSLSSSFQTPTIIVSYPSLGNPIEIIPQNSDGLILGYEQGMAIILLNGNDPPFAIITTNTFMRFAMIPPH
jgi:hypothetical protein